jgi:endonuclease/exonuclease/phosphatase family metal-dependent hydrolase
MTERIRLATFNLENLDDQPGQRPSLEARAALMRPQLARLDADVLCLQEIHAQQVANGAGREFVALRKLLEGTPYAEYKMASTTGEDGTPLPQRNLVILSRLQIVERNQYLHHFSPPPLYQLVTADPPAEEPEEMRAERPLLHARIELGGGRMLDVVDVHLKSKHPTTIPGQKLPDPREFAWKSASGWAEGFFVSSMKRVGQALETRMLVDDLFNNDQNALIVVCGDFNADTDDVPLQAIRGDVESTENMDLSRRVLVPCEKSIPEPARYSYLYLGKGQMIDHVLVSRSLLEFYRGSEIHNELLHDENVAFAHDEKYPESDHAPVVAHFELPNNSS